MERMRESANIPMITPKYVLNADTIKLTPPASIPSNFSKNYIPSSSMMAPMTSMASMMIRKVITQQIS